MCCKKIAAAAAFSMICSAAASAASLSQLPGEAAGAEVMSVPVTEGRSDTISGVVYSQVKSLRGIRALHMTVIVPRNVAKKPAVLYFPGGGFTSADHEKFLEMRTALAKAGFVVAACEYRTVPNKFPALLEDAKAAVRFIRAHAAEYGVDPGHIGVLGDSAGGYLTMMLGAVNGEKGWDKGDWLEQSSDVQAAVSMYGISNLLNIGEGFDKKTVEVHESPAVTESLLLNGPSFGKHLTKSILATPEEALKASAMGHVDGTEPPFLIMHGARDTLVSPVQSKQFYEALRAKNSDARYVLVENAAHGDLPWFQKPVIDLVVGWFESKLGTPQKAGEPRGGNR